jgi:hypothetical protein
MSRIHRIGRSLGVASVGIILVSGVSFAHDVNFDGQSSASSRDTNLEIQAPAIETDDRQGDDLDEVDELNAGVDAVVVTPHDLTEHADAVEPPEVETGDSANEDGGDHGAAKPAKAAKPPKALNVHKTETTSDVEDQNDGNDGNEADDNDQGGDHQDGDHQGEDHQGGDHHGGDSGGGGDSGSGGD